MNGISIIEYEASLAHEYKRLNIQWIERFFRVEQHDLEQLDSPEEYIISKQGYILFALYDDKVVGTCALIRTGDHEFELAKMAVDPDMQGKQIGRQLGLAAIEKAKSAGAKRIWLESNRILKPALHLYQKLGFTEIPMGETLYDRADIKMECSI